MLLFVSTITKYTGQGAKTDPGRLQYLELVSFVRNPAVYFHLPETGSQLLFSGP